MENLETYFNVKLFMENEVGKTYTKDIECVNILDASRLLNTYKPKRGYNIVHVVIDERVKFLYE